MAINLRWCYWAAILAPKGIVRKMEKIIKPFQNFTYFAKIKSIDNNKISFPSINVYEQLNGSSRFKSV